MIYVFFLNCFFFYFIEFNDKIIWLIISENTEERTYVNCDFVVALSLLPLSGNVPTTRPIRDQYATVETAAPWPQNLFYIFPRQVFTFSAQRYINFLTSS